MGEFRLRDVRQLDDEQREQIRKGGAATVNGIKYHRYRNVLGIEMVTQTVLGETQEKINERKKARR